MAPGLPSLSSPHDDIMEGGSAMRGFIGFCLVAAAMTVLALGLFGHGNHVAAFTERPDKEEVRMAAPGGNTDSCAEPTRVVAVRSTAC
jgi:hypothetical protein